MVKVAEMVPEDVEVGIWSVLMSASSALSDVGVMTSPSGLASAIAYPVDGESPVQLTDTDSPGVTARLDPGPVVEGELPLKVHETPPAEAL